MKKHNPVTRKGSTPLKVYCLPSEKEQIERQADAAGLSVASYLRNVGLGYEIRGILDFRCVEDLVSVNGDLGRVGGLLKMWLSNDERLRRFGTEQVRTTILRALTRIEGNQEELRKIINRVIPG